VGTEGGSQDHTAILCARPAALVEYAFLPVRYERAVPFPDDCVLVVAGSGVLASKTTNALEAYNRVAKRAAAALQVWRDTTNTAARTIGELLEKSSVDEFRKAIEHRQDLPYSAESLINRVEQFRAEVEIVRGVGDALAKGEHAAIGPLIDQSQTNAELLLENQVPETIALARSARELGAIAASAFGAGFGGSVYALVNKELVTSFLEKWRERYIGEFPRRVTRASFFVTRAGPSATRL
jgi:galactokinase